MDATRAALFEDILIQSERAEGNFEQVVARLCADRPDGAERLAEIMHAYRAVRTAETNILEAETTFPNEFPVFAEAWNTARGAARSASSVTGLSRTGFHAPLS